MKPARITILLVDDHEVVRQGLRSLLSLEKDFVIVGEAATAEESVREAVRLQPHLILLDMKLPDGTGPDTCATLLKCAPESRILMLTSYSDDTMVVAAIRSGAHGYLLKDIRSPELTQAIRAVASGQSYLDTRVAQQTLTWIRRRSAQSQAPLPRERAQLSPQERAILPLLAEGKTNKEIAASLKLSDKTVKNYLAHIFDKLQVSRRTEAVAWYLKSCQPYSLDQNG